VVINGKSVRALVLRTQKGLVVFTAKGVMHDPTIVAGGFSGIVIPWVFRTQVESVIKLVGLTYQSVKPLQVKL
jgi:hypothetical protein